MICVQHLWTGPISNAPVEIIQGGRSVEVRPVGVTKGLAMQRILGYMAHIMGRQVRVVAVVCCVLADGSTAIGSLHCATGACWMQLLCSSLMFCCLGEQNACCVGHAAHPGLHG
jgi:hypothetical protein